MHSKWLGELTAPFAPFLLLAMLLASIGQFPPQLDASPPVISDPDAQNGPAPEYLIITTSALKDGFEPLAEWRARTGLRTEIHLLDGENGILKGPGRDGAERLFNHLSSLWSGSNGSLRYVLLGGDDEVVPVRYLHAGASGWEMDDRYLSDVYYSSPATEWDKDGDGIYGERSDVATGDSVSMSFDIIVGRVPASTLEEAARYSQRVISYESAPPNGPWTSRFIMASSLMDRPNVLNDPLTEEDEGYDAYKDNGYKAMVNHTMQFVPRSLDILQVQDYPVYEGLNYNAANDTLGFDTIAGMISEGCSLFTFAGQSFYDVDHPVSPPLAYSLAQYIDPQGLERGGAAFGTALTYLDLPSLDNDGMLPVMYISSCDSANFSDPYDRDLSNIIIAPNGGAICLIGSTGVSWRGEGEDYSLGNWYLMSRFWQNLMGSNRPGEALYGLKTHYLNSKWGEMATKEPFLVGLYAYNLLGDPALSAWVGRPQNIGPVDAPETIRAGSDTVTVNVRTESDVPFYDASVSIMLPSTGEVFKGKTGPDGKVVVRTAFGESGTGLLCVRAKNHLPTFKDITVLPKPPDLEVEEGSIRFGPEPLTEGRDAWVKAVLRNNGDTSHSNVKAALFSGELGNDPAQWPEPIAEAYCDIPSGGAVLCQFDAAPDRSWKAVTVAVHPVEGELDLGNNQRTQPLSVNARPRFLPLPTLEVLEDAPGGKEMPLGGWVYDPDNSLSELLLSVKEGAPPWVLMKDPHTLLVEPPDNWSGSLRTTLSVWDGLAGDTTELQIFVVPENDAPVIVGLPGRVTVTSGHLSVLPLEVRDAEGDEVNISLTTSLRGLSASHNSLRVLPSEDDVGNYPTMVTVSDIYGASTNYSMVIEVISETPLLFFKEPSLHLPTAREGKRYSYQVKVGGALSSNATFQDNTTLFEIGTTTGLISFVPKAKDVGEHWVRISVSSGNVTISRSFMIEVQEGHTNPSTLVIVLGVVLVVMLVALIAVLLWKGPEVPQYGLEE